MTRHHRKSKHHKKKRLPFWKAVSRYGFGNALSYELRKPRRYPRYPIWFIPMLVSMVILAIILYNYPIDFLILLFYILELIVVGYMMYRLIKRLDRIKIRRGNLLRLWGLKILSGLISVIGILIIYYVLVMFFWSSLEIILNQEGIISQIVMFGNEWNTPFVIPFMFLIIGGGLLFIGAYLLFKFKMKAGNVIWVGRF
jgi:uncharacterized membrane protein YfcA